MTARTALLISNGGKDQDALKPAIARLEAAGFTLLAPECDSPETACRLIRRHAAEVDAIVVAGGDGTLNGAAPGLLDAGKPLGILPLGTANDLARTLALPKDLEAAAEVIAAGGTRGIDVGLANGKPFFNVASIGLAADLAGKLADGEKKRFGQLAYALAGLRVLFGARLHRAAVAVGDQVIRLRSYQIAVGNGRYHGGGMAVRPDARIDDGRLSLYSLGRGSLWKAVLLAPLFKRGRHVHWREVQTARAPWIEVRTASPLPVNLDGELATETPLRLEVRHCAIEVYAPADAR